MKLGILSCSPHCYSTRRLKEAAVERGHKVRVLNTLKFAIDLNPGSPDLFYCNKPLSRYDAVLPRIGASITYFAQPSSGNSNNSTCSQPTRLMPSLILATNCGRCKF